MFVRSPDAILNAGRSSSWRKSALGSSNTVPKSVIALLTRELAELEPFGGGELERLTVLTVRPAEGVLVVVGRVVERARVELRVVALLQLDRVRAALPRGTHERLRLLDVALVVVADLRDDVGRAVPRDDPAVDDQLEHVAMVLARPERKPRANVDERASRRSRSRTAARVPRATAPNSVVGTYQAACTRIVKARADS